MPVRNAKPYLKDCLNSIINQEYKNWELIAINDHSSDGSEKMLKYYSQLDSRINWENNQGKGIIDALKQAFNSCLGSFVTRMDADDLMTPIKLKIMQGQLEEFGPGHIALGQVLYFSSTSLGQGYQKYAEWLNQLTITGKNWTDLYKECVIPSPSWMVYKEDLIKAGAFDSEFWPEDYDLCFRFFHAGLKCIPSDKVLHHWRDYEDRTSRNDPHYADNRFLELKSHYFFKSYPKTNQTLVLWGAGKKGKAIANLIGSQNLDFIWLSNNDNKIGKEIYGNKIRNQIEINKISNPCIIIAVSNPDEQLEIKTQLEKLDLKQGSNFHFFF